MKNLLITLTLFGTLSGFTNFATARNNAPTTKRSCPPECEKPASTTPPPPAVIPPPGNAQPAVERNQFFEKFIKANLVAAGGNQSTVSGLKDLACGKTVVLTGNQGAISINENCPPNNPARVIGRGAKASGIKISGKGIIVEGFEVTGSLEGSCESCRLTRMTFTNSGQPAISISGKFNEVSFNDISKFSAQGIEIKVGSAALNASGTWIHHNYIHDTSGKPSNGHESIRILTDAYGSANSLIEYNYIKNVWVEQEDEAISMKVGGSMIHANVLEDPKAGITNRQAKNNILIDNDLSRSKGFNSMGDGHIFNHNRGKINLRAGNANYDSKRCPDKNVVCNAGGGGAYVASRKVTIMNHDGDVFVGERKGDTEKFPAEDNTIQNMSGKMTKSFEKNTTLKAGTGPVGPRVSKVTVKDVGPDAQ